MLSARRNHSLKGTHVSSSTIPRSRYYGKHPISMLTVLLLILSNQICLSQEPYLTIFVGGGAAKGSRKNPDYIAGSTAMCEIIVCLSRNVAAKVDSYLVQSDWPDGLTIHVYSSDGNPQVEWQDAMQFRRHVRYSDILQNSLRRSGKVDAAKYKPNESYLFLFDIPIGAIGDTIVLTASFNHPKYGFIETRKPVRIPVVLPQTDADQQMIGSSQIIFAEESGDYERTLIIVDSLIQLGYTRVLGLVRARTAAVKLNRYDAALRYLDLNMEVNGTYYLPKVSDLDHENEQIADPEEKRRENAMRNEAGYQQLRSEYLQKIAEQQQQQH